MGNPTIAEWLDLMADTVDVQAFVNRTSASGPTYSPTVATYPAYIEMKNRLIVDSKGREILARGRVILGTTDVIGVQDLVTLPVGYVPRQPPILAVNIVPDGEGNHHIVLEIG